MKRILSMIFILCLVVALSLSVSAESKNKLTYAVGASAPTVSANTEFTVIVDITENTGFCWLQIYVDFDSSVLTYVDANTDTSAFSEATVTVNSQVSGSKGKCFVTVGTMMDMLSDNPQIRTATGTVAVLKFKVKEGVPAGTTTSLNFYTPKEIAVKIVNGNRDYDFEIKSAKLDIHVADASHLTCTPGTATKENVVPGTCKTEGSYESVIKCVICGKELSRETVKTAKGDHTPSAPKMENIVPGTCKSEGFYDSVVRCTVCNVEISSEKVTTPKTDHTLAPAVKENVVAATCKADGSYDMVIKCSVCSVEVTRTKVSVPKTGHVVGSTEIVNIVDSTCTSTGSYETVTYCQYCKAEMSRTKSEIAKNAHTPGAAVKEKVVEATCKATGSFDEVVYCTVCKAEISRASRTVPTVDHTPGPEATQNSPQVCTVCNVVLKPAITHTHTWSDKLSSNNTGHWYACAGCSEKKDSASHTYDNNCDATCNVCGFSRTPGDHAYGNWTVVKEATATTDGQRERACIVCGNKVTEVIPATGVETTTPPDTTEAPVVTTDTEATTTEPTPGTSGSEVTTESAPGTTAPEVTDPEATTEPDVEDPGCGSAVSMGIALIAILGTALIMKKRD